MSRRRKGLRKQVTEAKKDAWSLGEGGEENGPGGTPQRELHPLRIFIWRPQGRTPVEMDQLSRCVCSGPWSLLTGQCQGRGSSASAADPEVSQGVTYLVLLLFWTWS